MLKNIPSIHTSSFEPGKILVLAGFIIFAALYFIYYPSIYLFRDEAHYLSMAYVLRHGTFFIDKTDIPVHTFVQVLGHKVSDYFPGMSFLVMPFTFLGWRAAFFPAFAFHLLGAVFFSRMLRLFRLPVIFTLLYLFYPPFIFYSRTMMSDIPAAVCFLIGVYFFYRFPSRQWAAGFFWGMSAAIRLTGCLVILPFMIKALIDLFRAKEPKPFLFLLAGFLPWMILLGAYSQIVYGSPFLTGYSFQSNQVEYFLPEYFLPHLKHYAVHLTLIYPGMIGALLFAKQTRRWEFTAAAAASLMFYSFYFFSDEFKGSFLTAVFSARFLFPVIPFFLLWYAEALKKFSDFSGVRVFAAVVLLGGCWAVQHGHQEALTQQLALKNTVYNTTPEDSVVIYDWNTAELIQKVWGRRVYLPYDVAGMDFGMILKKYSAAGVFLVKRDEVYAGKYNSPGIEETDLQTIFLKWPARLVAHEQGLRVYKFNDQLS